MNQTLIEQLTQNWLSWVILLVALVSYQQLWMAYFAQSQGERQDPKQLAEANLARGFSSVLINALPLLGLLGTIIGLLDCFSALAGGGANGERISAGIGDALLTTQLGLVCAIPGWLFQSWLRNTAAKPLPTAVLDPAR